METPKEILSEEDKKFIIENYNKMSVLQMAIRLNIATEKRKCPIISEFVKQSGLDVGSAPIVVDVKKPEPSIEEKIVDVVLQENEESSVVVDDDIKDISVEAFASQLKEFNIKIREPLSERERRDIIFLMHQMQSTRFTQIYKTYRKKEFKKLFKEEFIRSMYGKGEMPQEEVNDFIDMCTELVHQYELRCQIKEIDVMLEDKKLENAKKVGLMEVQKEFNEIISASVKRVSDIKKTLGTLREQRVKDNRNTGMTISALIEAFYDTEKRERLIAAQDKYDKDLQEALDKIDTLDETKALIMGISKEDLRNGSL